MLVEQHHDELTAGTILLLHPRDALRLSSDGKSLTWASSSQHLSQQAIGNKHYTTTELHENTPHRQVNIHTPRVRHSHSGRTDDKVYSLSDVLGQLQLSINAHNDCFAAVCQPPAVRLARQRNARTRHF